MSMNMEQEIGMPMNEVTVSNANGARDEEYEYYYED